MKEISKVKWQLESRAPRTSLGEANSYRMRGRRKAAVKGDKEQAESSLENREILNHEKKSFKKEGSVR